VLVKADYSQLQLRIAAKIADESRMLAAYRAGEDLHSLTARQVTGKAGVTKADRQIAKAVNFGLLFGLGAKGLRGYARSNYGLDLTEAAAAYRKAFFAAYPGLERWHRRAGNSRARECRTLGGRRRLLDDQTPYTHRLNTRGASRGWSRGRWPWMTPLRMVLPCLYGCILRGTRTLARAPRRLRRTVRGSRPM
jgi:DNA polymerase-1